MARIRSVKPELRRDLTVAEWPREVRYAWVLLFGYLDDYGRGLDDMRLLVADLFPLDRDVTERKLNTWLDLMAANNPHGEPPLCRYTVDSRHYLHAPKWSKSQKVSHPYKSPHPPCPVHERDASDPAPVTEPLPNHSGTDLEPFQTSRARADQGEGNREQGSKGVVATGKPSRATAVPDAWPTDDTHQTALSEWAREHTPGVDLRTETDNWQDWHRAKGDTAKDWTASWRTWMRRAQKDVDRHGRGSQLALVRASGPASRAAETLGLADRLDAAQGDTR